MDWHTLRGSQIVRVHRGPRGPGKPPGNTSRRHRTSSCTGAQCTGAKLSMGVWCTLVCVCSTHWSEVVHPGVQHPHCVVRGSLSSHSQAPRSKLELPPVINSASTPSFFLSLLHPFPKLCLTSASAWFICFTKIKHSPIFHCLFFFLGRSRILPCFSSPDT